MENLTIRLYEALFLVDSAEAATDWDGINEHIRKILERNGAEIVSMRKWDERPLAYPIMGRTRGTYILVYFKSPSSKISAIERETQLSERIMRVLILRADHITKEDMEKATPAMMADRKAQAEIEAPPITAVDYEETVDDEEDEDLETEGAN